ncbi:hypothetical protein FRC20_007673 [Serendipita sp. 405]|nr:hypothetical protein FRC20_007673 [Serendipita sp. 405]
MLVSACGFKVSTNLGLNVAHAAHMLHRLSGSLQRFSLPFKAFGIFNAHKNIRNISSTTQNVARSIRSAIQDGNINGGYHIFTRNHLQPKSGRISVKEALKNRYLAHVLLHTLHKANQVQTAITFAELCLTRGIRMNRRTFESVFNRTIISSGPPPSLTSAISLLAAARRSGHRHQSWMYDRIIDALLLQGEVLTAALLFCTIVKEWNRWRSQQGSTQEANTNATITNLSQNTDDSSGEGLSSPIPAPNGSNMVRILDAVEKARRHGLKGPQARSLKGSDAILALIPLLEHDCPVVPGRWQLLRALYRLPHEEWPDSATYERFNAAILTIFADLDDRSFDLASYHILLQYSIRERQSLELSTIVLRALCKAYTPSIVTYNIILRETARRGMDELFDNVNKLLTTSSVPTSSCEIMNLLSCYAIPKPDEFTIIAQMSGAISRRRPSEACEILVHIFPTLEYKAPTHSDARRDSHSTVQRASQFSPQFWATAAHAASKARSFKLSIRVWRLATRAERIRLKESQESSPLFGKEAYTTLLHFLHNTLSNVHRKINIVTQSNPGPTSISVSRLIQSYDGVLKAISDVLASLCDKTAAQALPLDAVVINALFSLVEIILLIERRFYTPPTPSNRQDDAQYSLQAICHRTQPHYGRILNSARDILVHHSIKIPKYLMDLGFREHKSPPFPDSSLHLQPTSTLPYNLVKMGAIRTRRYSFKVVPVKEDQTQSPSRLAVHTHIPVRHAASDKQTPETAGIS